MTTAFCPALPPDASGMGVASFGSSVPARGIVGLANVWPCAGVHFCMLFAASKMFPIAFDMVAW